MSCSACAVSCSLFVLKRSMKKKYCAPAATIQPLYSLFYTYLELNNPFACTCTFQVQMMLNYDLQTIVETCKLISGKVKVTTGAESGSIQIVTRMYTKANNVAFQWDSRQTLTIEVHIISTKRKNRSTETRVSTRKHISASMAKFKHIYLSESK